MAKELHLFLEEGTLGQLAIQLVVTEEGENGPHMSRVLPKSARVDEDVIKIHDHKPTKMRTEDVIHQGLECGRCICETKGEHNKLIEAIPSAERRLGDVLLLDADLVVARAEVNLGEETCTMEAIQEVVDAGDGVPVLDGDLVEGTVVHTQAEGSILLLHKEDG